MSQIYNLYFVTYQYFSFFFFSFQSANFEKLITGATVHRLLTNLEMTPHPCNNLAAALQESMPPSLTSYYRITVQFLQLCLRKMDSVQDRVG